MIHGTLMPEKGKKRNVMLQKDLGRAKNIFNAVRSKNQNAIFRRCLACRMMA